MMVIPSGSTILAPALKRGDHRLGLLVAGKALGLFAGDHADLLDPKLLGDRNGRPDLFLEFLARAGSGLVIPCPNPLTGEAENCTGTSDSSRFKETIASISLPRQGQNS